MTRSFTATLADDYQRMADFAREEARAGKALAALYARAGDHRISADEAQLAVEYQRDAIDWQAEADRLRAYIKENR